MAAYLAGLREANPEFGLRLYEMLDLRKIVEKLVQADDFAYVGHVIKTIHSAHLNIGRRLCDLLDKPKLAAKLSLGGSRNIPDVAALINAVREANPEAAKCLCALIDVQRLAVDWRRVRSKHKVAECVRVVCEANPDVGYTLRRFLGIG